MPSARPHARLDLSDPDPADRPPRHLTAAATRSFRAGVHVTIWATLASGTFTYAAWLPAAQKMYDATRVP
ncbi:MAG TPA: hypothetical protein VFC19_22875 [Candidatus Limnocylindrales bacterium]|nr:hypothetical protein [Candidatus Limnocylindrales bacterium]